MAGCWTTSTPWTGPGCATRTAGRPTSPGQLRALASTDAATRQRALHELYGNIYHQGTRYEATAFAVPFLVELVADPGTPDRAAILELLGAITVGFDETWLPNQLDIADHRQAAEGGDAVLARTHEPRADSEESLDEDEDEEPLEEGEEEDDEDDWWSDLSNEDEGRLYAFVALRAYDEIRARLAVVRPLLTDDDPAVRVRAAYLLAWYPEEAPASLAALSTVVHHPDEPTAAAARVATGLLGGEVDPAGLADPRPLVRWSTAVARAARFGRATDQASVDELLGWAGSAAEQDPRVPFLDGDPAGYAGLALGQVGDAALDEALAALVRRLPTTSGGTALAVAGEAMRRVFPEPAPASAAELDDRQRRVVEALAAAEEPWLMNGMIFGNFSQLVRAYGLPERRAGMATYLAG